MSGVTDQTYWILDRRQIEVLTAPRRTDVLDRLAASGPMSIRELASMIGARPSALYHHLKMMLDVGLVVEAGSRAVNRRSEKLYDTPARRMRLIRALGENKYPELLNDTVRSLTRQMARDFSTGAAAKSRMVHGEERNLGFFRLIGRPSPAQLARINANLAEILEVLYASIGDDNPLISFAWVMAPLERE